MYRRKGRRADYTFGQLRINQFVHNSYEVILDFFFI